MAEVNVYRAQPLNGRGGEPTVIRLLEVLPVPRLADSSESEALFAKDGAALADALYHSLPGGTWDQLLVAMLQRSASLLRVQAPPPQEGTR